MIKLNKKIKSGELYLLGYDFFLIAMIMDHTLFPMPHVLNVILEYIGLGVVCLKMIIWDFRLVKNDRNFFNGFFVILFLILSSISSINLKDIRLLTTAILILGAYNVNYNRILKHFIFVASTCLLITLIGEVIGINRALTIIRDTGKVRHTFGYEWPTDLAELISFILMADLYLVIQNKKRLFNRYIMYIIFSWISYYLIDARLGAGIILLLIPISLICKYGILYKSKIVKFILSLFFVICSVISIAIVQMYMKYPSNPLLINLDKISSYRLHNEVIGVNLYGYSWWGKNITSDYLIRFSQQWFYIDSSYLIFAIEYGLILLIFVGIIYALFISKLLKNSNYTLAVLAAISCIIGLIAQLFYYVEYNVFLLAVLAYIPQVNHQRESKEMKLNIINN